MRVTFLLPCYAKKPIGGARIVYQYANGLAQRGHGVTVVHAALLEPWQYSRPLRPEREVKIVARGLLDLADATPSRPSWQEIHPAVSLRYAPTLAAKHVPEGDVVFATSWRTAESIDRYPDGKGTRHYLIQHYEVWDGPKRRVDATWRAPLRKVVIAGWLADRARALGTDEVVRIPNAIDHQVFRVTRPVQSRPRRVAMLWSSAKIKGGEDGLRALRAARKAVPDLVAVLFGVGRQPAGLPDWVEYHRNPSQQLLADEVYNRSAVYLCPSWSEGWHLPPAEAMACGCALVSTCQGGVLDYAFADQTALLAPVRDTAALASHIVDLCADPSERIRISTAGSDLIRTFTWERSMDAFEQLILSQAVMS